MVRRLAGIAGEAAAWFMDVTWLTAAVWLTPVEDGNAPAVGPPLPRASPVLWLEYGLVAARVIPGCAILGDPILGDAIRGDAMRGESMRGPRSVAGGGGGLPILVKASLAESGMVLGNTCDLELVVGVSDD